jgi:hypothetical protein
MDLSGPSIDVKLKEKKEKKTQNFHCKWSATSRSNSSKKCNFESCPKLQRLNFQHWHFLFVSHPNLIYLFYHSIYFPSVELF